MLLLLLLSTSVLPARGSCRTCQTRLGHCICMQKHRMWVMEWKQCRGGSLAPAARPRAACRVRSEGCHPPLGGPALVRQQGSPAAQHGPHTGDACNHKRDTAALLACAHWHFISTCHAPAADCLLDRQQLNEMAWQLHLPAGHVQAASRRTSQEQEPSGSGSERALCAATGCQSAAAPEVWQERVHMVAGAATFLQQCLLPHPGPAWAPGRQSLPP